jgi:hypothetical protein
MTAGRKRVESTTCTAGAERKIGRPQREQAESTVLVSRLSLETDPLCGAPYKHIQ